MASPLKDKPRLTEQEKKNNHIASEQKRRLAIREGFDKLATLTPGMEGQGRSENLVLKATLELLRTELLEHKELLRMAEERGMDVSDITMEKLDLVAQKDLEQPVEQPTSRTGSVDM
jgi:heteromeric Ino2p/Ino4p transcription factor